MSYVAVADVVVALTGGDVAENPVFFETTKVDVDGFRDANPAVGLDVVRGCQPVDQPAFVGRGRRGQREREDQETYPGSRRAAHGPRV